ncbi:MAG: efflux RND transporter periplasmic adaptor subunit [Candidatus Curtissbacteria bacterium]|nr:efflux RND transporter periplasmic adaptor subunit [Candidatus Curtissbacteria bacterium]
MNLLENLARGVFAKIVDFKNWFVKASLIKKAIVVIAVGVILFFTTSPLRGNNKQQFTTASVTRDTISEIVSESGNVVAQGQVNVFSTTTGIVKEVYVKDHDAVKTGENLFKVTSTATPQEKSTALANYLAAKNTLNTANASYYSLQSTMFSKWKIYTDLSENSTYQNTDGSPNTTNRILPQFTTAQDDWLAAEANMKNQKNTVDQAQAAVNSAWIAYQNTQDAVVTALSDGTVGNLSIRPGDTVTTASSNATGTSVSSSPALVIGNPSQLSIEVAINEVDRPKVKISQKATVEFTAIKDKTFEGSVFSIDTYGTNTNGVITYNVVIDVQDLLSEVASGMTANIEIEANKHEHVLTVPNSAIKAYQGGKAVQVLDKNHKPQYLPVTIGLKGSTRTEIIEGVTEGTQIITFSPKTTGGGIFGGSQ